MKKQHLVPWACAAAMLVSVVASGLAGLILTNPDLLPGEFAAIMPAMETTLVMSAICAFVATSLGSMYMTAYAERAFQARHWHIFWLAVGFTAACLAIEVFLGKAGVAYLRLDVATGWIVAAVLFLAMAPRIMSAVLAWVDAQDEAAATAERRGERDHELRLTDSLTKKTEATIAAGNLRRQLEATDLNTRRPRQRATLAAGALIAGGAMVAAAGGSDALAAQPVAQADRVATLEETADSESLDDYVSADLALAIREELRGSGRRSGRRQVAKELRRRGYEVSPATIGRRLSGV